MMFKSDVYVKYHIILNTAKNVAQCHHIKMVSVTYANTLVALRSRKIHR
jgi:hypothetical protein